jgi:hypothetical protein
MSDQTTSVAESIRHGEGASIMVTAQHSAREREPRPPALAGDRQRLDPEPQVSPSPPPTTEC